MMAERRYAPDASCGLVLSDFHSVVKRVLRGDTEVWSGVAGELQAESQ